MIPQFAFGVFGLFGIGLMVGGTAATLADADTISPDSAVSIGLVLTVMVGIAWHSRRSGRVAEKMDRASNAADNLEHLIRAEGAARQEALTVCKSDHNHKMQLLSDRVLRLEVKREVAATAAQESPK